MSSAPGRVESSWQHRARTWLVLGRVSNLPTVWSNCLAAWMLGAGGSWGRFLLVLVGASLLYVGGMFLNDACDAEFDRRHRPERPIPSARIGAGAVWLAGGGALLLGWAMFASLGGVPARLAFLLVIAIVVYDTTHKRIPLAPALMALCRHLLFLAAASTARDGIDGTIVWCALVLGVYVLGLSYVAQRESSEGGVQWWAVPGLAAPLVLAFFMNPPEIMTSSLFVPAWLLAGWVGWSLTHLIRDGKPGTPKTVSGLLAGIVWVDLLAVLPAPWPWGVVFVALFGIARLFQRWVPAT